VGLFSDVLSRKQTVAQGHQMATQFAKRLRMEEIHNEKRVETEYKILLADAVAYQRRASLGVLGKSQLVNNFQWGLVASGYPESFAKEIGGQLAIAMAASG